MCRVSLHVSLLWFLTLIERLCEVWVEGWREVVFGVPLFSAVRAYYYPRRAVCWAGTAWCWVAPGLLGRWRGFLLFVCDGCPRLQSKVVGIQGNRVPSIPTQRDEKRSVHQKRTADVSFFGLSSFSPAQIKSDLIRALLQMSCCLAPKPQYRPTLGPLQPRHCLLSRSARQNSRGRSYRSFATSEAGGQGSAYWYLQRLLGSLMRGEKPQIDMQQLPELTPRAYQADLAALAKGTNPIITLPTGAARAGRLPSLGAHSAFPACLSRLLPPMCCHAHQHTRTRALPDLT